jgi:hypothetical protein
MTPEEHDKPVRDLIAKVFLPPDLCPSDPKDIEAMLDAAGARPLGEDQLERMLKKARRELPVGQREEEKPEWSEEALTEEERELVALHRNEGDQLPPEVEEKLRRLREKARAEEVDGDDKLET